MKGLQRWSKHLHNQDRTQVHFSMVKNFWKSDAVFKFSIYFVLTFQLKIILINSCERKYHEKCENYFNRSIMSNFNCNVFSSSIIVPKVNIAISTRFNVSFQRLAMIFVVNLVLRPTDSGPWIPSP